ncbi:hypothetical protein K438DRAFT_2026358 [Mycena galopus ATCC 62051]|nr:hypothetical protein K438DRAFT_2029665 [Mycena galopus ATCC 62051]KAF8156185.1 hypothetical protein K438DRAFT_2026358 [Mycena galopus ATCC 62051]
MAENMYKTQDNVIEISDDEPMPILHTSQPEIVDTKPVLRDVIYLCNSDAKTPPPRIKLEVKPDPLATSHPKPARCFPKGNKINISSTEKVDCVIELKEIPVRFLVPEVDTAYILDFSGDNRAKKATRGGKPKGLDALLKAEVSDFWSAFEKT